MDLTDTERDELLRRWNEEAVAAIADRRATPL